MKKVNKVFLQQSKSKLELKKQENNNLEGLSKIKEYESLLNKNKKKINFIPNSKDSKNLHSNNNVNITSSNSNYKTNINSKTEHSISKEILENFCSSKLADMNGNNHKPSNGNLFKLKNEKPNNNEINFITKNDSDKHCKAPSFVIQSPNIANNITKGNPVKINSIKINSKSQNDLFKRIQSPNNIKINLNTKHNEEVFKIHENVNQDTSNLMNNKLDNYLKQNNLVKDSDEDSCSLQDDDDAKSEANNRTEDDENEEILVIKPKPKLNSNTIESDEKKKELLDFKDKYTQKIKIHKELCIDLIGEELFFKVVCEYKNKYNVNKQLLTYSTKVMNTVKC